MAGCSRWRETKSRVRVPKPDGNRRLSRACSKTPRRQGLSNRAMSGYCPSGSICGLRPARPRTSSDSWKGTSSSAPRRGAAGSGCGCTRQATGAAGFIPNGRRTSRPLRAGVPRRLHGCSTPLPLPHALSAWLRRTAIWTSSVGAATTCSSGRLRASTGGLRRQTVMSRREPCSRPKPTRARRTPPPPRRLQPAADSRLRTGRPILRRPRCASAAACR